MPGEIDYSQLEIVPDPETREWWVGTNQHKYLVRQCNDCGHKWFPPSPICSHCNSFNVGWYKTRGTGTLYSYKEPGLMATMAKKYLVDLTANEFHLGNEQLLSLALRDARLGVV